MKKTYNSPASIQFNMQTEQMIAASLDINSGEADQLSGGMDSWETVDWSGMEEVDVEE